MPLDAIGALILSTVASEIGSTVGSDIAGSTGGQIGGLLGGLAGGDIGPAVGSIGDVASAAGNIGNLVGGADLSAAEAAAAGSNIGSLVGGADLGAAEAGAAGANIGNAVGNIGGLSVGGIDPTALSSFLATPGVANFTGDISGLVGPTTAQNVAEALGTGQLTAANAPNVVASINAAENEAINNPAAFGLNVASNPLLVDPTTGTPLQGGLIDPATGQPLSLADPQIQGVGANVLGQNLGLPQAPADVVSPALPATAGPDIASGATLSTTLPDTSTAATAGANLGDIVGQGVADIPPFPSEAPASTAAGISPALPLEMPSQAISSTPGMAPLDAVSANNTSLAAMAATPVTPTGSAIPTASQAASNLAMTPATGGTSGGGSAFTAPSAPATPITSGAAAGAASPGAAAIGTGANALPQAPEDVVSANDTPLSDMTGPSSGPSFSDILKDVSGVAKFALPAGGLLMSALNQPKLPSIPSLTNQLQTNTKPLLNTGQTLLDTATKNIIPTGQTTVSQGQNIVNTGQGLVQPLATGAGPGSLPAGAEAELAQANAAAKASIRSQYAQMGLSGSTMESESLANVDSQTVQQRLQIAQTLANTGLNESSTGISEIGTGGSIIGTGGNLASAGGNLIGGASQITQALLQQAVANDANLQNAINNFVTQMAAASRPLQATQAAANAIGNNG